MDYQYSQTLIHLVFSQNLITQGDFTNALFLKVKPKIHGVTQGVTQGDFTNFFNEYVMI
jgi:hypothetical protein